LTASKFYGIARFPAKTLPGQADAYSQHLKYYKRAGEYFDPQLVIIDIPYDGQTIQGYLHMPVASLATPDSERKLKRCWVAPCQPGNAADQRREYGKSVRPPFRKSAPGTSSSPA